MKTQILLTVEIDEDAIRRVLTPIAAGLPPEIILSDINRELRCWVASNPYGLQDPEHLTLKLAMAGALPAGTDNPDILPLIRRDLVNMANDLTTLANTLKP